MGSYGHGILLWQVVLDNNDHNDNNNDNTNCYMLISVMIATFQALNLVTVAAGDAGQRNDFVDVEACGGGPQLPTQRRAPHHSPGAALPQDPAGQQLQSAPH